MPKCASKSFPAVLRVHSGERYHVHGGMEKDPEKGITDCLRGKGRRQGLGTREFSVCFSVTF